MNTIGKLETGNHRLRAFRAVIICAALASLATLSFVFLPADFRGRRAVAPAHESVRDASPLHGIAVKIPGIEVRRLDRLAVITFTYDMFDKQQNLRPAAREKLLQLGLSLHQIHSAVAVEITGYAPETSGAESYSVGMIRAARVADCLVSAAELPPASVALRSVGDTELHGNADRPHAVVIMISPSGEIAQDDGGITLLRI